MSRGRVGWAPHSDALHCDPSKGEKPRHSTTDSPPVQRSAAFAMANAAILRDPDMRMWFRLD